MCNASAPVHLPLFVFNDALLTNQQCNHQSLRLRCRHVALQTLHQPLPYRQNPTTVGRMRQARVATDLNHLGLTVELLTHHINMAIAQTRVHGHMQGLPAQGDPPTLSRLNR